MCTQRTRNIIFANSIFHYRFCFSATKVRSCSLEEASQLNPTGGFFMGFAMYFDGSSEEPLLSLPPDFLRPDHDLLDLLIDAAARPKRD